MTEHRAGIRAKHYRMFAEALAQTRPILGGHAYSQWLTDVRAVADTFAAHSSGFERDRFMDAVGATAPLAVEFQERL